MRQMRRKITSTDDRKNRNRESAAKNRQKIRDRIISVQKEVEEQQTRYRAIRNEISLIEIELKRVDKQFQQHFNYCDLKQITQKD